jgi:hypothetical protein
MIKFREFVYHETIFIFLLLLIAAVPLVLFRGTDIVNSIWIVGGSSICWVIVCVLWLSGKGIHIPTRDTESPGDSLTAFKGHQGGFLWDILLALTLLAFTIVAFYIPMTQHWWSGTDEGFTAGINTIWLEAWEQIHARPLAGLPYYIALKLTPGSFVGYIWVIVFLRFVSALLVYGITWELFKPNRLLAVLAALLFVCNPSEHVRFLITSLAYYSGVLFFLLAVWLYFLSRSRQSRFLLVLSCISLGASLLQYETPFPLSLLIPVLLYFRDDKREVTLWAVAWYGTVALFAARFLHHIFTDELLYHMMLMRIGTRPTTFLGQVQMMLTNFRIQMMPVFEYLVQFRALPGYWIQGLAGWFITVPLTLWVKRKNHHDISRKALGWGIVFGTIALALSISPFVVLPITQLKDLMEYPTIRFQFYAAPVQAILWAVVISFIGSFLHNRLRSFFSVTAVSIMIIASVAGAYQFQSHHGVWNPGVDLKITSRIYTQVRALMPELKDRNYSLFFIIDDETDSPLGWSYGIKNLSCLLFGVPAYQGHEISEGKFEYRAGTGYASAKYRPMWNCTMVVFKITPEWDKVDLIGVTEHTSDTQINRPCNDCMTRFLDPPPDQPLPFLLHE